MTVDWVVLTAAVTGLSIAIFTSLGTDTHDYAERIGSEMDSRGIASY